VCAEGFCGNGDGDNGDYGSDSDCDVSHAHVFSPDDGGGGGDDGGSAVDPGVSGVDMDGVEEGPNSDGSDWDEIPTPTLLFGDACPCVRYPR
jgi:hypothetical protein